MKITVLGCGGSGGVPLIGNQWGDCDPNESRNRRTRVSVLVEEGEEAILIDTSPDLRQQLLANNISKITAVLFTHTHADHCHGIDELRSVNWLMQKPIDIYGHATTMAELEQRFAYIFGPRAETVSYFKPALRPVIIENDFSIGGINISSCAQAHGFDHEPSYGFRLNNFAYSTDVNMLGDQAFAMLSGIKCWVVDCLRETPSPKHSHLSQTLAWIERIKPERAWLTHMNHNMDYATLCAKLPPHVRPAYDGLVIEC